MKSCLSLAFAVLLTAILAAQTTAPNAPAPNDKDKEPAKCTVAGQVVQEPGGRPIRKATIQLTPVDQDDGTTYTADSNAEGHFKIDKIKPGRYSLWAEHNGFSSAGKHRAVRSLTLDPGQELKDLVLRLQPSAVIAGKILDNDGDPVSGAYVFVGNYAGSDRRGVLGAGQTNDLGEFRISNLRPGRYLLTANPKIQFSQPSQVEGDRKPVPYVTYYPGTSDKPQAVPVEVRAGDEFPANFALAYGPAFRVRGTVSGVPTTGGTDLTVMLGSKDAEWPIGASDTEVKKDGSFEIPNVLPGSYLVWLMNRTSTPRSMQESMQAAQEIEVKDSDLENVRFTPVTTSEVQGQLRMENGQKVDWSGVNLWLQSSDDPSGLRGEVWGQRETTQAQLKQDGSFDMKTVPPGNYRVMVFSGLAALRDYFVKSVNAGGKDVADTGFTVSGSLWSLDIVVSSRGATVEGGVVDDKNQPVADADVVLIPDANGQRRDLYQRAESDQHGHFKLRGLNPGGYTVMAFEELEDDYRSPEFLKAHDGEGQTLHVDEGEHKSIVLKVESSAANLPN